MAPPGRNKSQKQINEYQGFSNQSYFSNTILRVAQTIFISDKCPFWLMNLYTVITLKHAVNICLKQFAYDVYAYLTTKRLILDGNFYRFLRMLLELNDGKGRLTKMARSFNIRTVCQKITVTSPFSLCIMMIYVHLSTQNPLAASLFTRLHIFF